MPGRSGSTFAKLQKERARQQKQREKMERRHQRKQEKASQAQQGDASPEAQPEDVPPSEGEMETE